MFQICFITTVIVSSLVNSVVFILQRKCNLKCTGVQVLLQFLITQYVCCNCLVPGVAMIAYRMSATPQRRCGNPQIIQVENYTPAALVKEACLQ